MAQIKNLPGVILGKNFRKFHINNGAVVSCTDKYLGISTQRPATNKLSDFFPNLKKLSHGRLG